MLYREIIAVCSQIHTKHINTLCGQNAEFVNVKPVGTRSEKADCPYLFIYSFIHSFIHSQAIYVTMLPATQHKPCNFERQHNNKSERLRKDNPTSS